MWLANHMHAAPHAKRRTQSGRVSRHGRRRSMESRIRIRVRIRGFFLKIRPNPSAYKILRSVTTLPIRVDDWFTRCYQHHQSTPLSSELLHKSHHHYHQVNQHIKCHKQVIIHCSTITTITNNMLKHLKKTTLQHTNIHTITTPQQ